MLNGCHAKNYNDLLILSLQCFTIIFKVLVFISYQYTHVFPPLKFEIWICIQCNVLYGDKAACIQNNSQQTNLANDITKTWTKNKFITTI